jgi:hypothetical protein
MDPVLIPPPDSISKSQLKPAALPAKAAAPSILDDRHRMSRMAERIFRGVRFLCSGLLDNTAFQEVSLGQEVSVIFTANTPLVYRCRADNAPEGSTATIGLSKVRQKRRIASSIRIGEGFGRYFSVSGLFQLFMKTKSNATGPLLNATKPVTLTSGQGYLVRWRVSGKAATIDEFIEDQAKHVSANDLSVLKNFSGRLVDKLNETTPDDYPGMHEAVYAIVRVLEAPASLELKDPLPHWLAEIGFAACYFLERFDLIPDHFPEIGLIDDSLIVQRVIERNQHLFKTVLAPAGE